jgi:hypothetical protein
LELLSLPGGHQDKKENGERCAAVRALLSFVDHGPPKWQPHVCFRGGSYGTLGRISLNRSLEGLFFWRSDPALGASPSLCRRRSLALAGGPLCPPPPPPPVALPFSRQQRTLPSSSASASLYYYYYFCTSSMHGSIRYIYHDIYSCVQYVVRN